VNRASDDERGELTPPASEPSAAPAPAETTERSAFDPGRCVVLVPFVGSIVPDCEAGLRELERRGYPVRRVGGYAAIDQGRSQMATDALADGFDETFWIDSDIGFHPDDVAKLRRHDLPVVAGIYPQKGTPRLTSHLLPGTPRLTFGARGGLIEILYAGAGFLHVRRGVYEAIHRQLALPVCNARFGRPLVPYFLPLLQAEGDGHWYLAEDFAFCERARRCGFAIRADTTVRLFHVGACRYGWEDAGIDRPRYASFTLEFDGPARGA